MGWPDTPAESDAELILARLDYLHERQEQLIEAVNGLGGNTQWIVEKAEGLFQMFNSPAFMGMLGSMMGGMPSDITDGAGERPGADIPG